jgi:hypothetical protein
MLRRFSLWIEYYIDHDAFKLGMVVTDAPGHVETRYSYTVTDSQAGQASSQINRHIEYGKLIWVACSVPYIPLPDPFSSHKLYD